MATTDLAPRRLLARDRAARAGRSAAGPRATGDGATGAAALAPRRAIDRAVEVRLALLGGRAAAVDGVVLRLADAGDDDALRALAARDGAGRTPGAPVLLATAGGRVLAAIGVRDRRVLADPGTDLAAVVDRLQARAAELRGPLRRARRAARLRAAGGR